MNTEEQIKILCVKLGISVAELARLLGTSPQAFSQKMKRGRLTPEDLKKIASATDCEYKSVFLVKNGEKVVF